MRLKLLGNHGFKRISGGQRWALSPGSEGGEKEMPVSRTPFEIGRARNCHIILPDTRQLRSQTSRWHCYIIEKDGEWTVVDGSLEPVPEAGNKKPSVTGTFVNGGRIEDAAGLKDGDVLGVGPWKFEVSGVVTQVEKAEGVLDNVARAKLHTVDLADPRIREKFGHLHELVRRLSHIPDIEESLMELLAYCASKMEAAEVAAILLAEKGGGFKTRLAWQRGFGRIPIFRCSSALLESLPPDESFLLQTRISDPSISQSVHEISSGLMVPLWGKGERRGVLYLDNRHGIRAFSEEDLYLACAISNLVSLQISLEEQAEMERVKENMARYFAPDVVSRIIQLSAEGKFVELDMHERYVTVMFVDMEGFLKLSRERTPQQVSELLNPYLETVAVAIQENGGHVDKFIGDAVMGIFGANPGQVSGAVPRDYAAEAVVSGLRILVDWPAEAKKRGLPAARLRIGINSGRAVVGNIGFPARLEYSVLGDVVNLASRIEKLAPPNRIALGEEAVRLLEGRFPVEDLGERDVKGVGKLRIYAVSPPGT